MFESRHGRTVDITKPVKLYRNLHRNGPQGQPVYSVQQDGLVVGYTTDAVLRDGRFAVSAAGREKVRATGKKVVHAFAIGHLVPWSLAHQGWRSATYNPYRTLTFVDREDGTPVYEARYIALNETGAWYVPAAA